MGKKYAMAVAKVEPRSYALKEALELVKELHFAKFDQTVELAVRLGVDPKHSDQMVRGSMVLPHGTGKKLRVLIFAKGEKEREAKEAGADFVGVEEFIEKINKGWLEFDTVVATPDLMGTVGKLGKILGPRGLMPNPKTGTVTFDVQKAIREIRQGKVEYRVDKAGVIHMRLGKASFSADQLYENATAVLESIIKAKPAGSKGQYLRGVTVSLTMSPGVDVDVAGVRQLFD